MVVKNVLEKNIATVMKKRPSKVSSFCYLVIRENNIAFYGIKLKEDFTMTTET